MGPPHPRPVAANNTVEDAGGAQTCKRRNATGAASARKPAASSMTRDASQARRKGPAPSAEENVSNSQENGQGAPAARNETQSSLKKSASGAKCTPDWNELATTAESVDDPEARQTSLNLTSGAIPPQEPTRMIVLTP